MNNFLKKHREKIAKLGDSYTNNRIVQVTFDASAVGVLSGNCKTLILAATQDCYINFNQDTVTVANGFYLSSGSALEIELAHVSKLAVIKSTTGGKLTIMELF